MHQKQPPANTAVSSLDPFVVVSFIVLFSSEFKEVFEGVPNLEHPEAVIVTAAINRIPKNKALILNIIQPFIYIYLTVIIYESFQTVD